MFRKILVFIIVVTLALPVLSSSAGNDAAGSVAKADSQSQAAASEATHDKEGYIIGAGDVLDISVWKDEALTRSCVVRPDGMISFPLIGDIKAGDKTTVQLKAEMEKKLDFYVPGVVLSLEVKQVNSVIIYVIGKVNAPGRFVMNTNVDVLQAIAAAGGLNVYAKRGRIKILRRGEHETDIFKFDYDDVIDGNRLTQNIRLQRGDVVVVP